jgi:hypothetical protein
MQGKLVNNHLFPDKIYRYRVLAKNGPESIVNTAPDTLATKY